MTWEPVDLLLTADEIAVQLPRAVARGDWLDAYLLAAGLHQLVEDHVHPDRLLLRRASGYLAGRGARTASMVAAGAARLLQPPVPPRLQATRHSLTEATIKLASIVLGGRVRGFDLTKLRLPRFDDVLRVPSCFRSFDQHPDDVVELTNRYVDQFGVRTPVCVVGIRTSGSYLAPLAVAALRARGATAELLSYRPGRALRRDERRIVRDVVAGAGQVVLIDDPPVSGTALATAAATIGVPADRIVLLLALAGQDPPESLRQWSGIYLPWSEWSVHSRLREGSVESGLESLLGAGHRVEARPLPWMTRGTRRGRVRARYAVQIKGPDGTATQTEIAVEGAGLGFFGRHAVMVAGKLPEHCPHTYGLVGGLLYRDWLPETAARPDTEELVAGVVSYVADRGQALRVGRDSAALLRGRDPVWEVAAGLLSGMFGRLAPVGQVLVLDPVVRKLVRTTAPSVPDGQTDVRFWAAGVRKVGFDERSFGNLELGCYDEIFDLAGAAADPPTPDFEAALRAQYERRTGRLVDLERWLLYRLAHLWRMRRAGDLGRPRALDLSADAVGDYLAGVLHAGNLDRNGDLCAIDLDGTLETDPLGFRCTSPSGVLALRALAAHGFRPVLATGRSLPEVVARCYTFGLAGAVAEYGAVVYDHWSRTSTDLRDPDGRSAVEAIRAQLATRADVYLDQRYQFVVRAAHVTGGPLSAEVVGSLGSSLLSQVRVVFGDGQTDFVPIGADKGAGLKALATAIDPSAGIALAVGDGAEDLPMFALATIARAPRNAAPAVREAGIVTTPGAYQTGLVQACADLLDHRPGACDRCHRPQIPPRSAVLLGILGLRENGLGGLPARSIRLIARAVRSSRW